MSTEGLRERKKQETRDELTRAAIELFETNGFDAVTVDEIADAAGVSPRTFFRYFGSKEAVLFGDQEELLGILRDAIASQPPGMPPLRVLEEAVVVLAAHTSRDRERQLRLARLAETGAAPALYQRTVLQPLWEQTIAIALAKRLDLSPDDIRPRLLAGVGMAVMNAVGKTWTITGGQAAIEAIIDDAFTALGEAMSSVLDGAT